MPSDETVRIAALAMLNELGGTPGELEQMHLDAARAALIAAEEAEIRWQYGAKHPDLDNIVPWSRSMLISVVDNQRHTLYRRRAGTAPGPWEVEERGTAALR